MRILNRWLVAGAVLFAAATVGGAQAPEAKSAAKKAMGDAQVTAALESSRALAARAERLTAKAFRAGHGMPRWFSLMNQARRLNRQVASRLAKLRRVELSPACRSRYERKSREATARAVAVYDALIRAHVAADRRRAAFRLLAELRRFAPDAAAMLRATALVPAAVKSTAAGTGIGNPKVHPRTRAAKRPTGEEARWLRRRGYRFGPPARPCPRPQPRRPVERPGRPARPSGR